MGRSRRRVRPLACAEVTMVGAAPTITRVSLNGELLAEIRESGVSGPDETIAALTRF